MILGLLEWENSALPTWKFKKRETRLRLWSLPVQVQSSLGDEQMKSEVTIDVNKFMESFSIKANRQEIHLPSWITGDDDSNLFFHLYYSQFPIQLIYGVSKFFHQEGL